MLTKFLKSLGLFLLFSGPLYLVALVIWGLLAPDRLRKNLIHPVEGYLYQRLQEVQEVEDVDILFLGASTAYRSFDVETFREAGYKTFNLGSSAQTPEQTKILLERHLERLNPKVVIYEVMPALLENEGIEATIDLIANGESDKKIAKHVMYNLNMRSVNSLFFKWFSTAFSIENPGRGHKIEDDEYISGGFVKTEIRNDSILVPKRVKVWEPRDDQLAALQANIDLLQKSGASTLLVRVPLPSYTYQSFSNNEKIDALLEGYGDYMNFQGTVSLKDAIHFADEIHLNYDGAEIFNKKLLQVIEKKFPSLDERSMDGKKELITW